MAPTRHALPSPTPAAPPDGLGRRPPPPETAPPAAAPTSLCPALASHSQLGTGPAPRASPRCPPFPPSSRSRGTSATPEPGRERGLAHRVSHSQPSRPVAAELSHLNLGPAPSPQPEPEAPAGSRPAPNRREAPEAPPKAVFRPAPEPRLQRPGLGKKPRLRRTGSRGEALAGRRGAASLARAVLPRLCGPGRGRGPTVGRERGGAPWLRLPPLLRLLPFPRVPPGGEWVGRWGFPAGGGVTVASARLRSGRTRTVPRGRRRRRGKDALSARDLWRL